MDSGGIVNGDFGGGIVDGEFCGVKCKKLQNYEKIQKNAKKYFTSANFHINLI